MCCALFQFQHGKVVVVNQRKEPIFPTQPDAPHH
ncbi:hypothetical protein BS78_05G067400 [Paspalum vaginatum]|nr:hypothetical protein BS78_05G067400 [Paspalum vaginatum]